MRASLLIFLTFIFYLQSPAQKDTSGHGTIRISRPDLKAYVTVSAEYSVYLKKSDAPKFGKLKGSQLKYIKSKDLRSFGQNEENPMPLLDKLFFTNKKAVIIRKTDIPYDSVTVSMGDTAVDLSGYLSSVIQYTYKYKDAPAIDTVQLRIILDKKGKYIYRFAARTDSLNRVGAKCMEGLTTIRKWQAAHVFRVRNGNKKPRRIRAYSEILLTVVLSTENFEGEVTKKE